MAAKDDFFNWYLESAFKDMMEGKKWYRFSMATIRTCSELNMLKTYQRRFHVFKHGKYKLYINALGKIYKLTCNDIAYYNKNHLTPVTLVYSLPIY